ncbi:hypothetical protein [Streptomyces sp. NPDC057910]|uniref:hypothetical protein n=1 Tax=Streptomyces sp. NPDC057910 TaxID=3346278 RepID=UPI0036E26360
MLATPPDDAGSLLIPGDTGPRVIRRRVTYGDWQPVHPDHWANEHVGGNAEDCVACEGTNPPYPFICPGPGPDSQANAPHARLKGGSAPRRKASATPDPLAPFRALADQYAAKAAEAERHAEASAIDDARLAQQGIAAGWQHAEFLLRHTLADLDSPRTILDNPPTSDDGANNLVQVGWYCRSRQAVTTQSCCSDNVPIHVPAEWAGEMAAEIARRVDDADPVEADQPPPSSASNSDDAAAHFILTTICTTNGYRPPPPNVRITAYDLVRIDQLIGYGTPLGEAVGDVIGLAAWQAQQADAVLDQRIRQAFDGPEGT